MRVIPSREGGFWQLSYTHQMKSRTEYVREEEVDVVREEVAQFRKFQITLGELNGCNLWNVFEAGKASRRDSAILAYPD